MATSKSLRSSLKSLQHDLNLCQVLHWLVNRAWSTNSQGIRHRTSSFIATYVLKICLTQVFICQLHTVDILLINISSEQKAVRKIPWLKKRSKIILLFLYWLKRSTRTALGGALSCATLNSDTFCIYLMYLMPPLQPDRSLFSPLLINQTSSVLQNPSSHRTALTPHYNQGCWEPARAPRQTTSAPTPTIEWLKWSFCLE